ncbi:DUF559 domain-containing protein [Collinsella sp. zg1085]|uniref:DUF559 domain-containing protein n=1 Tax=Collinsella sp. zg1085 TaxID=2844380 RepID=UPI001C0C1040|nr:DUF559 domain-containing protein [Collinsella sp. zg1085]QWT17839.1 DUF559 domain-containing protein [Collinsella sp. zg1085]
MHRTDIAPRRRRLSTALLKQAPTALEVDRAREMLACLSDEPAELHVINVGTSQRGRRKDVVYHRTSAAYLGELIYLGNEIYMVAPELLFIQAGQWMSFWQHVEFGYELCGSYLGFPVFARSADNQKRASLRRAVLAQAISVHVHMRGVARARRALWYVREGSRSPMETAMMVLWVVPKRQGGLGIRAIEMDVHIPIEREFQNMTRRSHFYLDAYVRHARLNFEYDGRQHRLDTQIATDHERDNVLARQGIRVCRISASQLNIASEFRRVVAFVAECLRYKLPQDADYYVKQDKLRRFVIRHYDIYARAA